MNGALTIGTRDGATIETAEEGTRVAISPLAGLPAPKEILVDPARLEREYYERKPDPGDPTQLVSFGTSGHRGSSLRGSFNEAHILAITQAICEYRRSRGTDGPLYIAEENHRPFVSGPTAVTHAEDRLPAPVRASDSAVQIVE